MTQDPRTAHTRSMAAQPVRLWGDVFLMGPALCIAGPILAKAGHPLLGFILFCSGVLTAVANGVNYVELQEQNRTT